MDVRDFDFELPPELIAQEPPVERGTARLLCVDRGTGALAHTTVEHLPRLLRQGDVIVVNNTRVFPARLLGRRVPSGGAVECLLVGRASDTPPQASAEGGEYWQALMHPGQKLQPGARVQFGQNPVIHGEVIERRFHGRRVIRMWTDDVGSIPNDSRSQTRPPVRSTARAAKAGACSRLARRRRAPSRPWRRHTAASWLAAKARPISSCFPGSGFASFKDC